MFHKIDPKKRLPQVEEEILQFWNENKIFEKSLENRKDAQRYSFYDGPPFATGTPHYGHIVAGTMKDVVPRYWTMRGRYVERKWGWDCHGLPIENIVEKELGSKAKKDIEQLGVAKFNELCRSKVLEYVEVWKKVVNRLGRWADMENSYKTMDLAYMESVWWVFKQLWDKGLIYEGYRSMHVCTRCETTLSQQEVSEGYKDIKDLSAIAKFEVVSKNYESDTNVRNTNEDVKTYILAWTTTPWTLMGNVALAINSEIIYCKVKSQKSKVKNEIQNSKLKEGELYIIAKSRLEEVFKGEEFEIVEELKGSELIGKSYKPLFDYYIGKGLQNEENGWKIYGADFVTTEDGTGVVHIAPAFGEDDFKLMEQYALPFLQHVGLNGKIKEEAVDFAGMSVKPMEDHQSTDIEVIKYLAHRNLLFSKEKYEHSYPHCWRCDTPLINYATSSWFVNVEKIKPRALELAQNINWVPDHMKQGRFGKWLEGARDWSISRQRFWASVMPIWRCECGELEVFGSVKDLENRSGQTITDIHKHIVDEITFSCEKCGKEMKRIPDVLDTWFDSGSMPYAQAHYPFEQQEKFEQSFPAQFIAEGVDQTRAWFYYLHVIASAIKDNHAFENVIVNGIVLAEDGKKMSKKLKNYPDPQLMFDKYGADVVRFYLMSSPVVQAQNLNFSEKEVSELSRGMFRMLWNSYSFFVLYADIDGWKPGKSEQSTHLLDKWILSELQTLIAQYNQQMENYELAKAARLFPKFIDQLSNWYIRRSRKRFWKSENDEDKNFAYATLHEVLVKLSQLLAPFTPYIADEIYKNLTDEESVHLSDMPEADEGLVDEKLNDQMEAVRTLISEGLQLRAQVKIKVRQPLKNVTFKLSELHPELLEIAKDELNVKEITLSMDQDESVVLDTEITEDLRLEGQAREVIRLIQEMRKEAGYEVDNRIKICYNGLKSVFDKFSDLIAKETLADEINESFEENLEFDISKEFAIESQKFTVWLKK